MVTVHDSLSAVQSEREGRDTICEKEDVSKIYRQGLCREGSCDC